MIDLKKNMNPNISKEDLDKLVDDWYNNYCGITHFIFSKECTAIVKTFVNLKLMKIPLEIPFVHRVCGRVISRGTIVTGPLSFLMPLIDAYDKRKVSRNFELAVNAKELLSQPWFFDMFDPTDPDVIKLQKAIKRQLG